MRTLYFIISFLALVLSMAGTNGNMLFIAIMLCISIVFAVLFDVETYKK